MPRETIPGWDPIVEIYKQWTKGPVRAQAVVVEVGVALGRSLSWLADWCILNKRTDVRIYAVDSWCGNARNGEQQTLSDLIGGDFTLYAKMMLQHDPEAFELIRPLRAPSIMAAEMFAAGSVDLCVIDGDHSYEAVRDDLTVWIPCMRHDGWIGGDDHHEVHHPGVIQACKERFGDSYEVFEGANGWPDGRAWLKKLGGVR
jgi:hypothetical protein